PRLDDPARFDDWLDRILLGECRMRLRSAGGAGGAIPPVPDGLLAGVHATVALAPRPPRPPSRSRTGASRRRSPWRTIAAIGMVAVVVGIGVAVAADRGWLPGRAFNPASPSPTGTSSPGTSPGPGASEAPASPGPSPLEPLAHGTLAMVTLEGGDL